MSEPAPDILAAAQACTLCVLYYGSRGATPEAAAALTRVYAESLTAFVRGVDAFEINVQLEPAPTISILARGARAPEWAAAIVYAQSHPPTLH